MWDISSSISHTRRYHTKLTFSSTPPDFYPIQLMAQKLIIDTDPGIDDAFALTLAMLEPKLDVQVITATSGNVNSRQSTRNVQTIIELSLIHI